MLFDQVGQLLIGRKFSLGLKRLHNELFYRLVFIQVLLLGYSDKKAFNVDTISLTPSRSLVKTIPSYFNLDSPMYMVISLTAPFFGNTVLDSFVHTFFSCSIKAVFFIVI